MRLLALFASLLLTAAARADLIPSQFGVAVTCCGLAMSGGTVSGYTYIAGIGDVGFTATLTPTTVNFKLDETDFEGPGFPNSSPLKTVVFFGPYLTDPITSFTLDPSSTIKGIVPSVMNYPLGINPQTNISFDFTGTNALPPYSVGTATFDLTFASQAPAPEIDPSLASSALVLLAGAIAILRTRRTRQPA